MIAASKYKVNDIIKIKKFKNLPYEWDEEHGNFMGRSYVIRKIEYYMDRYEIYCKGENDFYFLESEVEKSVMFNKFSGDYFEI